MRWFREHAWSTLKLVLQRWLDDDGFVHSGAMAYAAALSLFPMCLIVMAGFGFVSHLSPSFQLGQEDLVEALAESTSPWLAERLNQLLIDLKVQAKIGGPLGLLTLLVAAVGIFVQLDSSLDRIWGRPSSHPGIWRAIRTVLVDRFTAFLLLLGLGAILGSVLIANLFFAGLRAYVEGSWWREHAFRGAQAMLTPVVYFLVFTIIYKVLPPARIRWRAAMRGGVLVAIVWWLGQQVLEWLVLGQQVSSYGIVGSFIAILLWFYYASAAVFLGAEYVRVTGERFSAANTTSDRT